MPHELTLNSSVLFSVHSVQISLHITHLGLVFAMALSNHTSEGCFYMVDSLSWVMHLSCCLGNNRPQLRGEVVPSLLQKVLWKLMEKLGLVEQVPSEG